MFYRPADGHGLPHNPFKALVSPRPIGWISTRAGSGANLAPYSFFNAVSDDPPQVMFAGGLKDSITNARESGVFAVNLVEEAMLIRMNRTSAAFPAHINEFTEAGIKSAECTTIDCPRVALVPATLECRTRQIIPLQGPDDFMVIGEVTGIHIREDCLINGRFDVTHFGIAARLGYHDYAVIREIRSLIRPEP